MSHDLHFVASDVERAALDEIRARAGFMTDDDVIACAVERLAAFLGIDLPPDAFAVPWNPRMRALLHREQEQRRR